MTAPTDNQLRERPTGELLRELSDQTTTLVKQEVELAKAELAEKAGLAGRGAGMFGGAGLFGLGAFAALTVCLVALLATALDHVWLAALIVTAVYAAVAGVLALTGKQKVQEATPAVPEQARDSVKEDVRWAKSRAKSGLT
jgi:hypothetical protein